MFSSNKTVKTNAICDTKMNVSICIVYEYIYINI